MRLAVPTPVTPCSFIIALVLSTYTLGTATWVQLMLLEIPWPYVCVTLRMCMHMTHCLCWRTEDNWAPGAGARALRGGQQVPLLPSHHLHAQCFYYTCKVFCSHRNMTENSFWNVFFPFCTACWWEMVLSALVIDYKIKILIISEKYCWAITNIQPIFNYIKVNMHILITSMQIRVTLSREKRGHTWNIWRSFPCSTHKITWEWTVCVQWVFWIHS